MRGSGGTFKRLWRTDRLLALVVIQPLEGSGGPFQKDLETPFRKLHKTPFRRLATEDTFQDAREDTFQKALEYTCQQVPEDIGTHVVLGNEIAQGLYQRTYA